MKKTLKTLLGLAAIVLAVVAMFGNGDAGIISAAMFITTSVSWDGKETMEYFIKPQFIGKSPWETQGVRVMPNIQDKQLLNYFGAASKILKTYAKGFSPADGVSYTQKTASLYRLKAEVAEDGNAFWNTVFNQALSKDDWNDISGTALKQLIMKNYMDAIASDVYRIFWLADPYKETVSGGFYTGTADADYNQLTGIWKKIFALASTTPTSSQIKRVAVTDGAVAQVQTATMTGTAGTANIAVNGVNYLATFATDLTTTNTNFVTLHAAALLLRGIVVTASTNTLIFTSAIVGQPFALVTVTNVVTNLAGTVAATTANTAPSALASGEAEDIFNSLYTTCDKVLKQVPKNQKVLLVSDAVHENYMDYLEGLSQLNYTTLVDGVDVLTYRGIPVIPLGWDVHLDADFPHATSALPAYPHRVIYTALDNIVMEMDTMNQYTSIKEWYNPDEEENRFRSKLLLGCDILHEKLTAVAY